MNKYKQRNREFNKLTNKYLQDNPSVKKALVAFNLSEREYKRALSAILTQPITISFKSTS